jgi:hypothetical protein
MTIKGSSDRWTKTPFSNLRAGADQRDEVGGIDGTPAVLCRLDEFERHRDRGDPRAGCIGDLLP